jgi:hypothetical protein
MFVQGVCGAVFPFVVLEYRVNETECDAVNDKT